MGGRQTEAQHGQGITHLSVKELEFLCRDDVRALLDDNIGRDPMELTLSAAVSGFTAPQRTALGNQLKYLQRARTKLPRYYAARCIIPPLAFEQCSSEESASTKRYEGDLCIDLTCGMGVDSLNFSSSFCRVVAIERDEALASITRHNLMLLGAGNVEVIDKSAEDFLASYDGPRADLVYVDPARRGDDGRRLFIPQECTPNVIELMPRLKQVSRRIVIKLSPLFDIDEAFRLFGPGITVEVVSSHNECKEVVVDIDNGTLETADTIKATSASDGLSIIFPRQAGKEGPGEPTFSRNRENSDTAVTENRSKRHTTVTTGHVRNNDGRERSAADPGGSHGDNDQNEHERNNYPTSTDKHDHRSDGEPYDPDGSLKHGIRAVPDPGSCPGPVPGSCSRATTAPQDYKYLLVPDVSLYKARLLRRYLSDGGRLVYSGTGFVLSDTLPDPFMGDAYLIESVSPYKPKALRQSLAKNGVRRLTILKKDFPVPTDRIASALGITQGGPRTAAFTEIDGEKLVFFLNKAGKRT